MTPTERSNLRYHAQTLLEALAEPDPVAQANRTEHYLLTLLRDGLDAGVISAWAARNELTMAEVRAELPLTRVHPDEIRSRADLEWCAGYEAGCQEE